MREELKETGMKLSAQLIKRLLKKGLKPNWNQRDFVGFLSVMASLHSQTKDWIFPSIDLYETLDPKSLTTLVLCLEELRKDG